MNQQNYSTRFTVEQSPAEVFAAINNVRGWWAVEIDGHAGELIGNTDKLGDVFTYRHEGIHYSKQQITELVPNKKVVWTVIEAQLDFVGDKNEWTNTEISFEIFENGAQTEVRFSHLGLIPEFECFDACSNAWGFYINGSLRKLIAASKEQTESKPA